MVQPLQDAAALGDFVSKTRTELGMTQAELATKARVSREWVARMESGAVRVELLRVFRVLSALGYGLTPTSVAPKTNSAQDALRLALGMGDGA